MLQAGPQPEPTSMHPGNSFWLPSALHAGALRQCPGRFGCPPLCMQALSGSVPVVSAALRSASRRSQAASRLMESVIISLNCFSICVRGGMSMERRMLKGTRSSAMRPSGVGTSSISVCSGISSRGTSCATRRSRVNSAVGLGMSSEHSWHTVLIADS